MGELTPLRKDWIMGDLYPYGVFPDGVPALYAPFGKFDEWKVQSAFRYIDSDGWCVEVEKHFKTDLASLPRVFRLVFNVNRREAVPAVIHDWGYRNNKVPIHNVLTGEIRPLTRQEWDRMFSDLMIYSKTAPIRRWLFWRGVQLGGWFHMNWRKK